MANRNTWWVTRPKRSLLAVPQVLAAFANSALGKVWSTKDRDQQLQFEELLEISKLKRVGDRRDQTGGGARTYQSWLVSLGLIFRDNEKKVHLTSAGEALVEMEMPPLPILKKQVLDYQFPSAFTYKGLSSVDKRFKVRPFIFILQLLLHPELDGYLTEKDEIAKLCMTYGESNSEACVEDVVSRILEYRESGDESLEADYLDRFISERSRKNGTLEKLFKNLEDIANTLSHWMRYTQLIVKVDNEWRIAPQKTEEAREIVREALDTPLIKDADHEEKFQRRYGLKPGQRKDTRNLRKSETVLSSSLAMKQVDAAFMGIASRQIVTGISDEIVEEIADLTAVHSDTVRRHLVKKYPQGSKGLFMQSYLEAAFGSRETAREFEVATASIFEEIFGFDVVDVAHTPRRPDILISSQEEKFQAILDAKAYSKGYSATIGQQNRMRDYIEDFQDYAPEDYPLAFFSYIVSTPKDTLGGQIQDIAAENGVPGSALSAMDLIVLVERHETEPVTHADFRRALTSNRVAAVTDFAQPSPGLEVTYDGSH